MQIKMENLCDFLGSRNPPFDSIILDGKPIPEIVYLLSPTRFSFKTSSK
jgi:hypothetical protein